MKFFVFIISILQWNSFCFGQQVEVGSGEFEQEVEFTGSLSRHPSDFTAQQVEIGSGFENEVKFNGSLSRHPSDSHFHSPCHPSPCMNGATCLIDNCDNKGCYDYKCNCPKHYEGKHCSKPILDRQLQFANIADNASICSADKCVGTGCECVESCRHENGYYCVNSMGFVGHNCTLKPPMLECQENQIVLQIPEEFIHQFTHTMLGWTMFVSQSYDGTASENPLCQAQLARIGLAFVIAIPLPFSTCGSTVRQGDHIFYNNTLWIDRTTSSGLYRFPQPLFDFSCSYEMTYIVTTSLQPVFDIPTIIHGEMKGVVSVELCKVSTCHQDCPANLLVEKGAVYTVAEKIHVNVHVNTNDVPNAFLTEVSEAYLSCSSSPDLDGQEVILQRGCEIESLLDVELSQRSNRDGACMSFRVPKMTFCQKAYLHITMRICFPEYYNSSSCGGRVEPGHCIRRQKRSISNDDTTIVRHSVGPLFIVDGQKGLDKISLKADNGDIVFGNETQSTTQKLKTQKLAKKRFFETRHLVIGFVAFAGTLLIICISLLVYSYSKRNEEFGEDSNLV